MNLPVRQAADLRATLGEGPVWDAGNECLWFVDIKKSLVWQHDPASGANVSYGAPEQVGWVLPADDGTLLAGLQDGIYSFDPASGAFAMLYDVPGEAAGNRLNDACTDPAGRLWFGSMDDSEKAQTGRFYCFDGSSIKPRGPAGICITNGPAVSPDGKLIYFTDTLARRIMVADLHGDGSVGPERVFTEITIPDAYPDGPTVDSEGYVWTGLWNGWSVARYSPDGEFAGQVAIPAANVTKLAFGGADLKTAYVTTALKGVMPEALEKQPQAGSLFAFESPVAGYPSAPVRMV